MPAFRYEIKYALTERGLDQVGALILSHPAGFKKAFPDRTVNSIYFDNINLQACQENLDGISDRTKIRYRWYGSDDMFNTGKIELKVKKNMLGTKKYLEVSDFNDVTSLTKVVANVVDKPNLFATLRNQYLRQYYVDISGKIRLTVDTKLGYWLPEHWTHFPGIIDDRVIIEVKFEEAHLKEANSVLQNIPFRRSKHSKYATGILSLL